MEPHHWSLVGLLLDVIGAFFLSVEAVKLENLAKLRDRVLLPLHHGLKPILIHYAEDGTGYVPARSVGLKAFLIWFFWHFLGGVLVVAPFLWLSKYLFDFDVITWLWGLQKWLWPWARIPVATVATLYGVVFVAAFPGEVAHKAAERGSLWLVKAFYWIDRRTPDGTIGICGFCLLLMGFIGQMVGTWLGRTPS